VLLSQPAPSIHGEHRPPPQSTSVSSPSMTELMQDSCKQVPRKTEHAPVEQSSCELQTLPAAQGAQVFPPQSTSLSSPLST